MLIPETSTPRRTTAQEVLDWVIDLHQKEQIVTREVLMAAMGFKLSIIDEHLKNLVNDGKIRRVRNGVFQPVQQVPPPRAMSHTLLPDGWVKLEVGDDVLMLTAREARMLGSMMQGHANLAGQIDLIGQVMAHAADTAHRIQRIERLARGDEQA